MSSQSSPLVSPLAQPHTVASRSEPSDGMPLIERHQLGHETREWLITPRQCPALGRQGVFLAGWSEARAGFDFARPRFPMSQLLFCTDGEGEVMIGSQWQPCRAGQAYLTPPRVPHAYRALPGATWSICWITYHLPIVNLPRPMLVSANVSLIAFLLRQLRAEALGANDVQTLESWVMLVQTQVERQVRAARALVPPDGNHLFAPAASDGLGTRERLRRLWEQVSLHPQQPWDVARLASQIGVSGEHLRRLCQQELGCSPMQQVARIRIAHAAQLLTHGRHTLTEIAEQVGYSNPFVLSNAFYRLTGIRPSQYLSLKNREIGDTAPTSEDRELPVS